MIVDNTIFTFPIWNSALTLNEDTYVTFHSCGKTCTVWDWIWSSTIWSQITLNLDLFPYRKNSRLLWLHVTFTIKLFVPFIIFYDYGNWRSKETKTRVFIFFDTTVDTHHFNVYLNKHSITMSVSTSIQEQGGKKTLKCKSKSGILRLLELVKRFKVT